jgi:hypothetical protein
MKISCKKCKSLFPEALYDELNQEQKEIFNEHIQQCAQCSHEFAEMRSALEFMHNPPRPDLDQYDWNPLWEHAENQIQQAHKKSSTVLERLRELLPDFREVRWAYQTVVVMAVLLIGILIGSNYFSRLDYEHIADVDSVPPTQIEDVSLVNRTTNYLGRSKLLLLGLVNFDSESDDPEAIDFSHQKKISSELITEAAILKEQLTSPQQLRLLELISELEVVLMQIANLEEEYDLDAVELIQSSAERKGILFKIRIEELLSGTGTNRLSQTDKNDTTSHI